MQAVALEVSSDSSLCVCVCLQAGLRSVSQVLFYDGQTGFSFIFKSFLNRNLYFYLFFTPALVPAF